jgi:hypothetical protein
MLRGRHCSYVTVHRNETYLYFNDLRGDAERPGRRPRILREQSDRSSFSQMPPPRAFASPRARGRNQRITPCELLVRLCAGETQSRCATKSRRMIDRGHCVHVISIRRRIQVVKTVASRARSSRNHAATRFAFPSFAVSLALLAATAALGAGVAPNYQIQLDSSRRSRSSASRSRRLLPV